MPKVMVLNTDRLVKTASLCDWLVWHDINFTFEKVGAQYTVSIEEKDVQRLSAVA